MRTLVGAGALVAVIFALVGFASAGVQPPGDINCDGRVTSVDAAIVLQYDAGLIGKGPCHVQGDASFDGIINSLDAAIILQREAGLLSRCSSDDRGFKPALTAVDTIHVPGQTFSFTFSISNCHGRETTRRYGSGQIYDFIVRNEKGETVWNWAFDFGFVQVVTDRTYGHTQTVTYGAEWDQLDNDDLPVEPGTYTVETVELGCTLPALDECNLTATIEIQILLPPEV